MKRLCAAFMASLLCAPAQAQLAEYGIEGLWTVSTRDDERRASVSPDGQRIVWGSADRAGGPGGGDLWQARREGIRWVDPQPLPLDTPAEESEPAYSADGRWLYFVSDRKGGHGGRDLYRAAVGPDGGWGQVENLGATVNTRGDERSPTPSADGAWLLFSSDGHGGAGGLDLFVARVAPAGEGKGAQGAAPVAGSGNLGFATPTAVPGANTAADEIDAAWLGGGRVLLFSRGEAAAGTARLYLSACDGTAYADVQPWTLSFNVEGGSTHAPVVDASRPADVLVIGSARAPKAGKGDVYRVAAPSLRGRDGCLPPPR